MISRRDAAALTALVAGTVAVAMVVPVWAVPVVVFVMVIGGGALIGRWGGADE